MSDENVEPKNTTEQSTSQGDGPKIVVVGSINMDLVVRTPAIPGPGQTVPGSNFSTIPGGKGANQAVAAARCGGRVSLIGRVGNDDFGQRLLLGLKGNGVDISAVMVSEAVSTGTAIVMVDNQGENSICVAGGANLKLSIDDIDEQADLIATADVIVMQLEIPLDTVVYTLELARYRRIPVILNPSPVPAEIHPALFNADILIPNQDETSRLCGEPANDLHSVKLAGSALVAQGAKTVVVTLGRRGAWAVTTNDMIHVEPFAVKVVDTTGAGDAFCGAFAVAYARQVPLSQATRFAGAAGALACTKFGAQPAMPHLDAVERLLKRSC